MIELILTHAQACDLIAVIEASDLDLADVEQELVDKVYGSGPIDLSTTPEFAIEEARKEH